MNLRDPDVLHAFLLERVREKTEADKLDFKLELNLTEQRDKLNLVREVNAIVNTYDLRFDDHGFLIYGMNREDGRVTRAVPLFQELGTDSLENQVGQLLRAHIHPAPQFNVFGFDEPEVGPWGVIVIWPDQTPPFTFIKAGTYNTAGHTKQMWRKGEWRVRRNASVVEPGPEDYAHMLQARIQAATAPLREEVRQLQAQVHRLEGAMQTLQAEAAAELEVQLLQDSAIIDAVSFVPPTVAGRRVLEPHLARLQELAAACALANREPDMGSPPYQTHGGWIYHAGAWSPMVPHNYYNQTPENRAAIQAALHKFLQNWELAPPPEDLDFSKAFLGSSSRYDGAKVTGVYGPDAKRARAYEELLLLAEQLQPKVHEEARTAPFQDFTLKVHNPSSKATGLLKVSVAVLPGSDIKLVRFAPKVTLDEWREHEVFHQYAINQEVVLPEPMAQRDNLLPGETWDTPPFGLRFSVPGNHQVLVKILGEHLRTPLETALSIRVDAETYSTEGAAE